MKIRKHKANLIGRTAISDSIYSFRFSKPKEFEFKEGQYISVDIDEGTKRSYSISSTNVDDYIETIVDTTPGGIGTQFLLDLKEGDSISFLGPLGFMVLEDDLDNYSCYNFICTGTGISPFKGMIRRLLHSDFDNTINLLYSEKDKENFVGVSDHGAENFNVLRTLTREDNEEFLTGRVTDHLDKIDISNDAVFYLCGNFNMIQEVKMVLEGRGIKNNNIKFESFYS